MKMKYSRSGVAYRPWECIANVNGGLMYFSSPWWVVELRGGREGIRSINTRGNAFRGKIVKPKREREKGRK